MQLRVGEGPEGRRCTAAAAAASALQARPSPLPFPPPALLPLLCLVFLAALAGCQGAKVDRTVTADHGGGDPDAQLDFWHTLADQPITSNDDAFHGLLLYLDGTDESADYEQRVAALKSRGLLPQGFDAPADAAVDRGTLAVAIAKHLNIHGGLVMSLTGPSPRYATRELVFLGIYPPSSPNQTFSGTEFLGIIGKLEDYQRGADPESGTIAGGDATEVPATDGAAPDQPAETTPEAAPAAGDVDGAESVPE